MAEGNKDIVLSIRGMSKSFGRNKVLKHIDMDVPRGSIMGLMGENGAGKSTMMKCLFGTYQKDEGTIILDGKEISFTGPKDALENGVPNLRAFSYIFTRLVYQPMALEYLVDCLQSVI